MYADSMTVAAARDVYFADNGFTLAGYADRWVKLRLGPIPIAFPNTASRKAAVKLHDLHHVATGYATSWVGEIEIGAWEVAAGCGRHWAAWVLNLGAMGVGIVRAPRRLARAFIRGRHSRTLYDRQFGDDLLALSVGELRGQLGLDRPTAAATAGDIAALIGWLILIAATSIAPLIALWLIVF